MDNNSKNINAAAIIAEYNPFHSGHAYHITRTRKQFGATHIVAIMSGNFVQRGDCACLSKWDRARMALLGGVDLVIELPLPWASAGAERFALGGAAIADALGCVSTLSFGSECGNIAAISDVAAAVDSDEVRERMKVHLESGISFAAARDKAVSELCPGGETILRAPNDTLGAEYVRALRRIGSDIRPVCILREGAGHNSLTNHPTNVSSSYIREMLKTGDMPATIPPKSADVLYDAMRSGTAPALLDRLDRAILYRLRCMDAQEIAALPDISEGLENRIYSCVREARSVSELCDSIKTKRYSMARIRRILLAALLGQTESDGQGTPPYIRVLGMNEKGRELLGMACPKLPVITRFADLAKADDRAQEIFAKEMLAGDIFALATPTAMPCGSDASHGIIII